MKNEIIDVFSEYVSKHSDVFLNRYTADNCVFKKFLYFTMHAKRDINDRSLADSLNNSLQKIPQNRREKIMQLIVGDLVNYIIHMNKNYAVVIADVNNVCNLNCPNCAYQEMNCQSGINWSLEEINTIINKLKDYTRLFAIAGGEPFINPNLVTAIKQNPDVAFVVFTNGSINSQYQRIVEENLNNIIVMVSIDGNKEYHDNKRGKDVFDNAVKTVKFFRDNGFICGVSSVVEEQNIDYLFSQPYIDFIKSIDASALFYLKDALNTNIEFIKKYYSISKNIQNSLLKDVPSLNFPYCEQTLSKEKGCFAGRQWFRVNANFEVTACPFTKTTYGNIYTEDAKTIVKKLKYNTEQHHIQK